MVIAEYLVLVEYLGTLDLEYLDIQELLVTVALVVYLGIQVFRGILEIVDIQVHRDIPDTAARLVTPG